MGASLGTAVKVRCEVDAFPPATAFSWIFNNSKVCSKGVVAWGAPLGTPLKVCCEVDAFPPATAFSWIFNNSKVCSKGVVAVGASLGTAVKIRCEVDTFPLPQHSPGYSTTTKYVARVW